MKSVTVWLSEKDAYKYPFPHKIGDRVRSQPDGLEGIVKDAKYEGPEDGGPASVIYRIQTDNGLIIDIPILELEKVKED